MLPTAIATTSGVQLTVVDVLPMSSSATADATGTATIQFDQVESGWLWLVTAMSVRTTSTTQTRCAVFAGSRLMDGSDTGNFDFSDRNSPVLVNSAEQLSVVWTGATPGAVCTFDGQYQLVTRG